LGPASLLSLLLLKLLLRAKADPRARDEQGQLPLYSCPPASSEARELLLRAATALSRAAGAEIEAEIEAEMLSVCLQLHAVGPVRELHVGMPRRAVVGVPQRLGVAADPRAQHGAPPPERFCLDPQHVALFAARGGAVLGAASSGGASSSAMSSAFASSAATAGGAAAGVSTGLAQHGASLMSAALLSGGEDGGSERGLAVRYVKLVSSAWTAGGPACKCSPRRPLPTGT
jgi:hypothetical protein